MWIDFFFFLHPLLEVDRCHCPCGPSSCFKLPVVAVLQRRSSFPFCACFTFFQCLSPVWSFFASCLGNIHHFLMPFTSLFPPFEYWTNLICISCSLHICFASVLLKRILFFSITEKREVFHYKQDILDPIKKSAMIRRKTKHATSFSENYHQFMAFVACLSGKNDQFEFEIVCFLIDGYEWDRYQFVPNSWSKSLCYYEEIIHQKYALSWNTGTFIS